MKRFQDYVWMAAGFAVLAAVISGISAGPAVAQLVKAALVKNVDEPGRNPFVFSGSGPFTVPTNMRYVVEHYSATCDVDTTGAMTNLELRVISSPVLINDFAAPRLVDANSFNSGHAVNRWVASGNTRVYANPGATLFLITDSNSNSTGAQIRSCTSQTISGYSVSLP